LDSTQTISVQCNSDEVVTAGGFKYEIRTDPPSYIIANNKQDNGWSATWHTNSQDVLTVYAECLKVVSDDTTG
jgi:hypothetical protein